MKLGEERSASELRLWNAFFFFFLLWRQGLYCKALQNYTSGARVDCRGALNFLSQFGQIFFFCLWKLKCKWKIQTLQKCCKKHVLPWKQSRVCASISCGLQSTFVTQIFEALFMCNGFTEGQLAHLQIVFLLTGLFLHRCIENSSIAGFCDLVSNSTQMSRRWHKAGGLRGR